MKTNRDHLIIMNSTLKEENIKLNKQSLLNNEMRMTMMMKKMKNLKINRIEVDKEEEEEEAVEECLVEAIIIRSLELLKRLVVFNDYSN